MPEEGPPPRFLAALDAARHVVLTGHEHPDGDCIGSMVGLFHLLRRRGAAPRILLPDAPSAALDFVTRDVPIEVFDPAVGVGACDLLVLLDCAQLGRLGRLGRAVAASRPTIAVIDHHVGSLDGDGDVAYVDVAAAATGELVHRLHAAFGVSPDPAAATALFVSLVADTGWFRYSNTDARVLALAAELTACGVDVCGVYDLLHRRQTPRSVTLLGELIAASRLELDGRLGVLAVSHQQMRAANDCGLELDQAMEPLRSVRDIEVVAMLKPTPDGAIKLSLRSQRDVDVQAIARSFGGGGHRKAAGATIARPPAEVLDAVRAAVRTALDGAGSP